MKLAKKSAGSALLAAIMALSFVTCGASSATQEGAAISGTAGQAGNPTEQVREQSDVLGYTPDDLRGRWAEKIAGRGIITIDGGAGSLYNVRVEWAESAARQHIWEMEARPADEGGVLVYEKGRHILRTYKNGHEFTDEVKSSRGTGKFFLNSAYELMWEDDTEGAGDNTVFVNCTAQEPAMLIS